MGCTYCAHTKRDGQICVCRDYQVIVNANVEVDQHPLLKPEDPFTSVAGCQKFSKLKNAHHQILLDS